MRALERKLVAEQLDQTQRAERILDAIDHSLIVLDRRGVIQLANQATRDLLGYGEAELHGMNVTSLLVKDNDLTMQSSVEALTDARSEVVYLTKSGEEVPVLFSAQALTDARGESSAWVCVATDLRDRKRLEVELRHAQKLESVGQLAAGVAHEINTPIQFIGDSIHFLRDAFTDFHRVFELYRGLKSVDSPAAMQTRIEKIELLEVDVDMEFLEEEIPKALARTLDGVERVASIVRAMKEFAHPSVPQKAPADLNHGIETTLTVARNEYKYVADVELDLGPIPRIHCHIGDLNQVVLNLVVNAAHAIEDRMSETRQKGRITIGTRRDDDHVIMEISDTGGGIPKDVAERIFDPFFTTKEVGRGTGQGLAIARTIVVDKHEGEISFQTGSEGTSFRVRLPIDGGSA